MNRKPNEKWTLRLGLSQVVILLGVTTGCLALSFYLGFFSGKRVGFSEAMETNIALVPKVPIESDVAVDPGQVDSAEKTVADVYANLKNTPSKTVDTKESGDAGMPEIGVIEKVDQKAQKDLADVFGDDVMPIAKQDSKGTSSADPWASSGANNQAEPMVLGDDLKEEKPAKSTPAKDSDAAIDKALDGISTPVAAKTVVAVQTPTIAPTTTVKAQPTLAPTQAPTKTPTATPTKAKTPVATENGASITRSAAPRSGWYAQVAAPTAKSDADSLASTLRTNGFRVVIESAEVRGEAYYRILVGPEENRAQAEALVKQLSRESYLKGSPFIRMIK